MKILFLTTPTRPEVSKISLESLKKSVKDDAEIIVCNDKKLKGHAYNFNESLSKIGFDDDIVKCDDDLVFYDKNWFKKYLKYLNEEGSHIVAYGRRDEMGQVSSWGCLMMIPKNILRDIGYMYEGFGQYGYSDPEYRFRITRIGHGIWPVLPEEALILHDEENIPVYQEFRRSNLPEVIERRRQIIQELRPTYDSRLNELQQGTKSCKVTYKKYADIPSV